MKIKISGKLYRKNEFYFFENEQLRLFCYANSLKDLIETIIENIEFMIENYLFEKEENLTENAIELKNNLKKLLK